MTNGIAIFTQIRDPKMATCGPDMDFCSAGEDDYLETEIHSPTDSSEDSVEVKVSPITSLRNKRKCSEPRRVQETFTGPLKKRMCLKIKAEENHPFRPWSPKQIIRSTSNKTENPKSIELVKSEPVSEIKTIPVPSFVVPTVPVFYQTHVDDSKQINHILSGGYFRPPSPIKLSSSDNNAQPVPLIKKDTSLDIIKIKQECVSPNSTINLSDVPRVPTHPQVTKLSTSETERLIMNTNEVFPSLQNQNKLDQGSTTSSNCVSNRREQRNYKNMTRERRIEANARERTRVHTISAAFDTLRKSVPAYSHNQKLSKLSVLRIACSYIMTLSSIVNEDQPSTTDSVEMVSKTIQREGKLRKKKDDND